MTFKSGKAPLQACSSSITLHFDRGIIVSLVESQPRMNNPRLAKREEGRIPTQRYLTSTLPTDLPWQKKPAPNNPPITFLWTNPSPFSRPHLSLLLLLSSHSYQILSSLPIIKMNTEVFIYSSLPRLDSNELLFIYMSFWFPSEIAQLTAGGWPWKSKLGQEGTPAPGSWIELSCSMLPPTKSLPWPQSSSLVGQFIRAPIGQLATPGCARAALPCALSA